MQSRDPSPHSQANAKRPVIFRGRQVNRGQKTRYVSGTKAHGTSESDRRRSRPLISPCPNIFSFRSPHCCHVWPVTKLQDTYIRIYIYINIYIYICNPPSLGTYLLAASPVHELPAHLGLGGTISQLGPGPNETRTQDLSTGTRTKLGLDDPPQILTKNELQV